MKDALMWGTNKYVTEFQYLCCIVMLLHITEVHKRDIRTFVTYFSDQGFQHVSLIRCYEDMLLIKLTDNNIHDRITHKFLIVNLYIYEAKLGST